MVAKRCQNNTTGCKTVFSCYSQPLLGKLIQHCLNTALPQQRHLSPPHKCVTPLLAAMGANNCVLHHSNNLHCLLRQEKKPPALQGQARGDPCCWNCFVPFPADGGHPQFSHHHLDPSCKERHCDVTGVTDSNTSSCYGLPSEGATRCWSNAKKASQLEVPQAHLQL